MVAITKSLAAMCYVYVPPGSSPVAPEAQCLLTMDDDYATLLMEALVNKAKTVKSFPALVAMAHQNKIKELKVHSRVKVTPTVRKLLEAMQAAPSGLKLSFCNCCRLD